MIRKPRKDERQARILEALRHTPHIRIALLAERFKVTTETIRRDMDSLSRRGLVNRAHGGVVAQPMGVQPSIFEREPSTVDARSRIATLAAQARKSLVAGKRVAVRLNLRSRRIN